MSGKLNAIVRQRARGGATFSKMIWTQPRAVPILSASSCRKVPSLIKLIQVFVDPPTALPPSVLLKKWCPSATTRRRQTGEGLGATSSIDEGLLSMKRKECCSREDTFRWFLEWWKRGHRWDKEERRPRAVAHDGGSETADGVGGRLGAATPKGTVLS